MAKRPSTVGIVIHHTAGNEKSAAELRSIFKNRFGVNYIGYHRVITPDGTVWGDLALDEVGIHNATGAINNMNSIGISLVGNFELNVPTKAQLDTLVKLIREMKNQFPTIQRKNIVGHRDMKATACPGKNLYPKLPTLISLAYQENDMSAEDIRELESLRALKRNLINGKVNEFKKSNDPAIYQILAYGSPEVYINDMENQWANLREVPADWPIDPELWASQRNFLKPELDKATAKVIELEKKVIELSKPKDITIEDAIRKVATWVKSITG
jgi:hypothetical protein